MRAPPGNAEGTGGNGWERVRFVRELRERVGNADRHMCLDLSGTQRERVRFTTTRNSQIAAHFEQPNIRVAAWAPPLDTALPQSVTAAPPQLTAVRCSGVGGGV